MASAGVGERNGLAADARHNALLQSVRAGIIRVFAACTIDRDAQPTLLARGAFLVSVSTQRGRSTSRRSSGRPAFVPSVTLGWTERSPCVGTASRWKLCQAHYLCFPPRWGEMIVAIHQAGVSATESVSQGFCWHESLDTAAGLCDHEVVSIVAVRGQTMKPRPMICIVAVIVLAAGLVPVRLGPPAARAQVPHVSDDRDLGAYSREATDAAKARLKETTAAVFAGGRYGFIRGRRVSLDPEDWQAEAVIVKDKVMVPKEFALAAFGIKRLPWFGLRIAQKKGMVSISDLAARRKKKVFRDERGLVIVTDKPMTLTDSELIDSIVTLFDTPEKFADPVVACRNIPSLRAWGNWKDHVRFTPEQLALYDSPETDWSLTSEKDYDLAGFARQYLGSAIPPAGVHPRVLFSPEDISTIVERLQGSSAGRAAWNEVETRLRRSWLDPNAGEGAVFRRLCAGAPVGLEMDGQTLQGQMLGIRSMPLAYVARGLSTVALYGLLAEDGNLGQQAATAFYNYCKLLEPRVDACNGAYDVFNTHWCAMNESIGGANLGLCYDFAARWMTEAQKSLVRRVIVKAIAGRRGYGQDGPVRVRDTNRVTRDLTIFLADVAIEAEEGFDQEVYDRGVETVKAFLQWGISPAGTMYESERHGDEGMETLMLSIIALARRGENAFGHPHLRRLLRSQIQCTSPSGRLTTPRGPYATGALGAPSIEILKTFFPDDLRADFLLAHVHHTAYDDVLPAELSSAFIYAAPWSRVARIDLDLPLDFSDAPAGVFTSRSDNTGSAVWVSMQARPDLYVGAARLPHDAGSFHLEADGVLWTGRRSGTRMSDISDRHSIVFIDGVGQDDATGLAPPRVDYLGAEASAAGAVASADLRYAYEYVWAAQIESWNEKRATDHRWELETDPFVVNVLKGTQRHRITYESKPPQHPWFPVLRAELNPVQYAFRSVALIRGNHPYVVVVDDIRKDDRAHRYEWSMAGEHNTQSVSGLGDEYLVLADTSGAGVQRGTPMLLINEVGPSVCKLENRDGRTSVSTSGVEPRFRLLLIPFRWGAEIPRTAVDEEAGTVTVKWRDQNDALEFSVGKDNRTRVSVSRDGKEILRSK